MKFKKEASRAKKVVDIQQQEQMKDKKRLILKSEFEDLSKERVSTRETDSHHLAQVISRLDGIVES